MSKEEQIEEMANDYIDEFMDELYNLIADANDINPIDWYEVEAIAHRLRMKYTESEAKK